MYLASEVENHARGAQSLAARPYRQLCVQELIPALDQVVILIRPLVPVGNVRSSLFKRTAIAQIARHDATLGLAFPRLTLVPEGVFLGIHRCLDIGRRRIVTLLGD